MLDPWELPIGTQGRWEVQATNEDETLNTTFTNNDTPQATVWLGQGQSSLFHPLAVWKNSNASAGVIGVTFTDVMTASLDAGTYPLAVDVIPAPGGGNIRIANAWLRLTAAPTGLDTAIPVYGDIGDMLDYEPDIEQLLRDTDMVGFARQRGRARSKLDGVILDRYGYGSANPFMIGNTAYPGLPLPWANGLDVGPSKWLKDQLAANLLMITDKTREIVAKWAISYVYDREATQKTDGPYQALAQKYRRDADNLVKTLRAEIDLNGDGWADVVVNCGASSRR